MERYNAQAMERADTHNKEVYFQSGDLVWIHMMKERFPSKCKSKIMPRSDDPFEILEKIGHNAYKLDLPSAYGVSGTFNVADLNPYFEENEEIRSLRSNSNQLGEDDGDHPSKRLETLPNGPEQAKESKVVRKVHAIVLNHLNKLGSEQANSSEN